MTPQQKLPSLPWQQLDYAPYNPQALFIFKIRTNVQNDSVKVVKAINKQ